MATDFKPATRKRIPKLSDKPEPGTGRYYTSYRAASGSARRQRFTKDRKGSKQRYRRWVIEHDDDSVDIIIRDGSGFNGPLEWTLPYIANALVQHDEGRAGPSCGTSASGSAATKSC